MNQKRSVKNIPKPTHFGKNLKFLRRMRGLSQNELSKHLNLNRNNIASYESGVVEPNVRKVLEICRFFNVDPSEMLSTIFSENPAQLISPESAENPIVEHYLVDQLEPFVKQTNEMTKVLEGYREFIDLKSENIMTSENAELYGILQNVLELMEMLVQSNWNLIQSVFPGEEE